MILTQSPLSFIQKDSKKVTCDYNSVCVETKNRNFLLFSFVFSFFLFLSKKMATLGSGVLVKLVEEMGSSGMALNDRKPVLLQIRSIIPVLAEDDLWPNQGFYLKVSDSSHAMFVSLLQEQDDMVLCNQLQLGQLIFVEKLEAAHPVPVLKGIRPLPGRLPCVGNPADLFAIDKLVNSKGASDLVMEKDRGVEKKPRGRYRSLSASKSCPSEKKRASRPGNCDAGEREMRVVTRGFRKISSSFVEKDSDSDSTLSSSSSVLTVKRKSWNGAEQVADSLVVKHGMKPTGRRSCSAHVSVSLLLLLTNIPLNRNYLT